MQTAIEAVREKKMRWLKSYASGTKKCIGSFKNSLTEKMAKTLVRQILEVESHSFAI